MNLPVANLRLLYKLFPYMILRRLEPVLDAGQPDKQLGSKFRSRGRMDEHLLTTSPVIDQTRASNASLWILSLDLSKAFDTLLIQLVGGHCGKLSVLRASPSRKFGYRNVCTSDRKA